RDARAKRLRAQHGWPVRRRRQSPSGDPQRLSPQRLGGAPRRQHARRPLPQQQFHRQQLRRLHEQPRAVDDLHRQLLGRLPRLRSRSQWRRRRSASPRSAVLGDRRASVARAHPHAFGVRRAARERRACTSLTHAERTGRLHSRHEAHSVIEFSGITKRFGRLDVLRGVNLRVTRGRVLGIVGPNGSGKTTLIKLLLGLAHPTSGDIQMNGVSIVAGESYRAAIGYMPQIARFPENLSAREVLALIRDLRRTAPAIDEELLSSFNLAEQLDKPLRTLSGGTRQKVNACLALLFRPSLLVLDEPTAGLDPLSSALLKDKLLARRAEGATVIVTSHIMSELEELCDDVAFLLDGVVRYVGPVADLTALTRQATLERAIAALMIREVA